MEAENGRRVKYVVSAKAVDGDQLYKSLCTMRDRYNVEFEFCKKVGHRERNHPHIEGRYMNSEGIKSRYSMRDIAEQYGFHPNRAGFIPCPFHQGDRSRL